MGRPSIIYRPREDATAECELGALAAVYAYLLKNRKNVEPAQVPDVRDDVKESHGYVATKDINR